MKNEGQEGVVVELREKTRDFIFNDEGQAVMVVPGGGCPTYVGVLVLEELVRRISEEGPNDGEPLVIPGLYDIAFNVTIKVKRRDEANGEMLS